MTGEMIGIVGALLGAAALGSGWGFALGCRYLIRRMKRKGLSAAMVRSVLDL